MALYLQGILDFLKGPEWLAAQDGVKLHSRIVNMGHMEEAKSECILKTFWMMIRVACNYKLAQERYAAKGEFLMTLTFWNDYLKQEQARGES